MKKTNLICFSKWIWFPRNMPVCHYLILKWWCSHIFQIFYTYYLLVEHHFLWCSYLKVVILWLNALQVKWSQIIQFLWANSNCWNNSFWVSIVGFFVFVFFKYIAIKMKGNLHKLLSIINRKLCEKLGTLFLLLKM